MMLEDQMSLLFIEEAAELLVEFEQSLLLLESLPDDEELLTRVFRCAHTLKGNSKILGFGAIVDSTHELEGLLDRLRRHELAMTRGVADTLLVSLDVLKAQVAEIGGGAPHDKEARVLASTRIAALVADLPSSDAPRASLPPLDFGPLESKAPPPSVPFRPPSRRRTRRHSASR